MSFLHLVLRNLARQRVRSVLTIVGISLGITTVVALGVVTAGLEQTATGLVRSGGAEFMLAQKGAADLSFSRLPEATVAETAAVPGVAGARGALFHITKAGSNPFFFLIGRTAADLRAAPPDLVRGRMPRVAGEIALGQDTAADLDAAIGDTVEINKRSFHVVGVSTSDVSWERAGALALLGDVQQLMNAPDSVTVVYVDLARGANADAVAKRVRRSVDGVAVITSADDYGQVDQGFEIINAANLAISLLAVLIGGIGVMNTMVMSIFERTREIGVLRAVGWTRARVLRMILIESIALCLVAGFVGALLGAGIASLVTQIPAVGSFLVPRYTVSVFLQGFVVAVIVGLIGAAYPAWRATRLTPMEALRYE